MRKNARPNFTFEVAAATLYDTHTFDRATVEAAYKVVYQAVQPLCKTPTKGAHANGFRAWLIEGLWGEGCPDSGLWHDRPETPAEIAKAWDDLFVEM